MFVSIEPLAVFISNEWILWTEGVRSRAAFRLLWKDDLDYDDDDDDDIDDVLFYVWYVGVDTTPEVDTRDWNMNTAINNQKSILHRAGFYEQSNHEYYYSIIRVKLKK